MATWGEASFSTGRATLLLGEQMVVLTTEDPASGEIERLRGLVELTGCSASELIEQSIMSGRRLDEIADLAMVIHDEERTLLLLRGEIGAIVEHHSGEQEHVGGSGLLTWVERSIDDARSVELRDERAGKHGLGVQADQIYRAERGVLPAASVHLVFAGADRSAVAGAQALTHDVEHGAGIGPVDRPGESSPDADEDFVSPAGDTMMHIEEELLEQTGENDLGDESSVSQADGSDEEPIAEQEQTPAEPEEAIAEQEQTPAEPEGHAEDLLVDHGLTGTYDALFGATQIRSVEDAARRVADDDASPGASGTEFEPEADLDEVAHDGHTIDISALRKLKDTPREEVLAEGPTILASLCGEGHPNPPFAPTCRICGASIGQQEPSRIAQPPLVRLVTPDGKALQLDRGVIVGRSPKLSGHLPDGRPPQTIVVDSPERDVSRSHLEIRVEGWSLLAVDLNSANGTTAELPGRPMLRLRPGEPQLIEIGTVLRLADEIELRLEAP